MKLPDGWEKIKIKNAATVKTGPFGAQLHQSDYVAENGTPIITVEHLSERGLIHENLPLVSDIDKKRLKQYIVSENDIVFSRVGSVDRSSLVAKDEDGWMFSGRLLRIQPDKTKINSPYLIHFFHTNKFRHRIRSLAVGGTMPSLNTAILSNVKIVLPPLPEQKAIADLLSTWDEAIEKTERLIQAKERQLDAYGRELFNRKNEMKYKGWKKIALEDILTEHKDKSEGTEEVYSVSVHKGLVNQVEHLGRSFSAANTDHYNKVHYGDIVYTKSPTGDFPLGIVKQSHTKKDVIVSPLYGVFTPASFSLGVVIDFYFSSPTRARNYLFPIIQKGAKNTIAITNKTFLSKKLYLPLDEEAQNVISDYVTTSKKEINLLKQLAEKYKTQKRGLMQKMLKGEWRMKEEIIKQYCEA